MKSEISMVIAPFKLPGTQWDSTVECSFDFKSISHDFYFYSYRRWPIHIFFLKRFLGIDRNNYTKIFTVRGIILIYVTHTYKNVVQKIIFLKSPSIFSELFSSKLSDINPVFEEGEGRPFKLQRDYHQPAIE